MEHAKTKFFTQIASLILFISFLITAKFLKDTLALNPVSFLETSKILLLYLNIPVFFIWVTLGIFAGLASTVVSVFLMMLFFEKSVWIFPAMSFFVISFLAYRLNRNFESHAKGLEIETEKMDEESNLLSERIKLEENNNLRMRSSSKKTAYLKKVIEDYSLALSEAEVLDSVLENSFDLFQEANRVLVYLVDTEKQELMLLRSKKRGIPFPIREKRGDVFDRWVLKHATPLLVEDIKKDFRFSDGEDLDRGFNSIISIPLMSEQKVFGTLRVDSVNKGKFTQSDLRFLDIIADLSAVSLENAMLYKKVQDLAIHDSLTGLYVKKYFDERLKGEIKRSLRNNTNLSVLMLDIDNFKDYNDRHGHNAGDLALMHISSILKSFARPGDIVSRYGGEEFILLLLNREKLSASRLAEDIRKKINESPLILRREETRLTVSIGVASSPSEEKMADELVRRADARLYKAKEKGKNSVCAD